MNIAPYLLIARFDHWFKNVFVLPGIVVAVYAEPAALDHSLWWRTVVALLATGFIASSNYVINEVLDAPMDALHPVKRNRPVPSGRVNVRIAYVEWILLAALGIAVAWPLGPAFTASAALLWIMGCIYNIPPVRSKDQPYLDVLSEAVNNPLRLLLGWYATGIQVVPPISLVIAYWMVGAFFMAVKRFGEYRRIGDPEQARAYRRSFGHYNEERLLVSITYYGVAFGLFFGIFLMRYRVELILSMPVVAAVIAWYIHLGFKADSPTQYPEHLYKQRGFMVVTLTCLGLMLILLFVDVPQIGDIFVPTIRTQGL